MTAALTARRCPYNHGEVHTAVVVPSTATKSRHRLGGALKAVVVAVTATRERAPHVHGRSQRVIQRKRGERCQKTPASRKTAGGTRGRIRGRPCASRPGASNTPSAPGTSAASASSTPTAPSVTEKQDDHPDPVVEEALPDAPILSDEEDEKLYPGYVQQNNEEHAANEDYIPAKFSHTDEDERREDHDIGAFEDADEDRPVMMYDRDNPSIDEGVFFPEAVDCRNAVETFSIKSETEYITLKSDQSRFTVKCAYDRCKWRLHASLMRRSTLF
ncbi:hypothetical protein D1007_45812 [Hordeum vulgare]|nr:hypothetical protein D1007_45812 [Hordeum vulgare]